MHHANHYYGHSHVLARYCGLDDRDPPRIHGYLQHGWNIGDGMAPDHEFVPGVPLFLWSERTRRRAWSLGRRQTYVVGAPWAYLLAMEPDGPQRREGTIWYPFHGWEGQRVVGDHGRLIDEIRSVEAGPVTVCLYWQEYRSTRVRQHYERAGFRVVCHGYRGGRWRDLDPGFLHRQLAELRGHRRVASNRLCSAIYYGILAGCEPAVYGDPMQLAGEAPVWGGQPRIRRQWAQLHGPRIDRDVARELAVTELGADRLLPPVELRRLLRWPEPGADAAGPANGAARDGAAFEQATPPVAAGERPGMGVAR
ncbi:hypothetical protein SAMN05443287_11493 [Micromonospora phaseoli]|uniref:Uncharacterized protein n=1 Tax=Micromonospora phaseoli TaxID=1144548 RepID=A0A1H7DIL9_9ACTN|nr:hypothetical protein [Micromonospora phaseoli]PZW02374.1 hypothetical protein CLV64_102749 [Micromonospora phaseoli]GIJ75624.1 hypothetical protein Xph01_00560 [Micromonospora phaseoli]SEK01639.1 hypothetical protein SAMN05443287_11493 [Micromonospora phaseoli]